MHAQAPRVFLKLPGLGFEPHMWDPASLTTRLWGEPNRTLTPALPGLKFKNKQQPKKKEHTSVKWQESWQRRG